MRRKGLSISDIAITLGVSKSSVSQWCEDIQLTKKQRANLLAKRIAAGNVGRQKGAEMNRAKRTISLAEADVYASKHIKKISNNDLFFLGLGLYWGEGIKSRSGPAAVVNSDPRVLRVAVRWFCECLGVDRTDIRPYIYISRQHEFRENIIVDYWVQQLSVSRNQFLSPIYISQKPTIKYENHDSYYGVVALRIRRSATLKYKIVALIKVAATRLE